MPRKFPTAFTILFVLIVVVAALTWIIPAGQYERALNPALGKEAPVPGTYTVVEFEPAGSQRHPDGADRRALQSCNGNGECDFNMVIARVRLAPTTSGESKFQAFGSVGHCPDRRMANGSEWQPCPATRPWHFGLGLQAFETFPVEVRRPPIDRATRSRWKSPLGSAPGVPECASFQ